MVEPKPSENMVASEAAVNTTTELNNPLDDSDPDIDDSGQASLF